MEKERKLTQISQLEHAKRKSMWVGSKKIQTTELYCINEDMTKMILTKIKFAPAWYKILDEIIVNAIDQWVNYPKKVKQIKINFDTDTGVITILNSGPSIGVYETTNLNGKKMYAPQLIASEFLSGDNLGEDADDERITGGTNGAGLKLTNAFSEYLTITTLDTKTKKYYIQHFKDRLNIIEKPIIRKAKASEKDSFTQIEFLPCYKIFGYDEGYKPEFSQDLEKLIITRTIQAYAYTNIDVYYNDNKITIPEHCNNNFYNFSKMYILDQPDYSADSQKDKDEIDNIDDNQSICSDDSSVKNQEYLSMASGDLLYIKLNSDTKELKKFPWDVCIGTSDGKFRQVSLINGIYVYGGGSHIKHIQNLIVSNLKTRVEKLIKKTKNKFNPNYIINNLFIFVKCSIVRPEFTSQIKDTLNDPIEKFSSYSFKTKDYNDMWKLLEPCIMSLFLDKYKDKKKTRVTRGAINVPKCTDAKYAGHKTKYKNCTLIICEGDSAMGTVHDGITNKSSSLGYELYGTFSIQGVPMNARKEISIYTDKKTKEVSIIRNAKLQKNERLTSLVKVLGLDYEKTYSLDKKGDEEFETLRYGKITAAVDQDDDGKGNIFGLIINFFILFWPELTKRNYITRFNTPIIRLYPKVKSKFVEEFQSLKTYELWINEKYNGDDEKVSNNYNIKYYKGLGSHKKLEIPHMFKDFEKNLCTYKLDEFALMNLEAYFGNNTDLRKKALSTPILREETIGKLIDVSEQLERDLKAYQRDNILRKLPHMMDGSVPSRRKVIYTARNVFGSSNAEMKVNAFVNETSKSTHYHHGEMSLAGTVTKMAQEFPGARHLPFLRPQGQFGTRSNGGKDSADPRYTYTQLNKPLCFAMFPKDDDFLLKYVFDDGVRCEPEFYCPIIPLSILENMEIPATGWKVKLWARDIFEVINNVKSLINSKVKKARPMGIWLKDNIGSIKTYKGQLYSVGKYTYNPKKKQIIITELPLGKYSSSFIGDYSSDDTRQLCNKPQFKSKPEDRTNDDGVHITFNLTDTGYEEIIKNNGNDTFDPIEDFMNLKTSLDSNINMIGVDGSVIEYKKYEHVIDSWFPYRKKLYGDRIDRHIILTNLMILYLKNIIRFTQNHQKYDITPKTKLERVSEILIENNYDKFNATLLHSPKYTDVYNLEKLIIQRIDIKTQAKKEKNIKSKKEKKDKKVDLSDSININTDINTSINYEYLIKLSYRDMIECACIKRQKLLEEYEEKLKNLLLDIDETDGSFKGKKTWLTEIDELEKVIKLGLKLGWSYGKDVAKFR